jgi:hypothetical protein
MNGRSAPEAERSRKPQAASRKRSRLAGLVIRLGDKHDDRLRGIVLLDAWQEMPGENAGREFVMTLRRAAGHWGGIR